jgi:hypothetical protein
VKVKIEPPPRRAAGEDATGLSLDQQLTDSQADARTAHSARCFSGAVKGLKDDFGFRWSYTLAMIKNRDKDLSLPAVGPDGDRPIFWTVLFCVTYEVLEHLPQVVPLCPDKESLWFDPDHHDPASEALAVARHHLLDDLAD